MTGGDIDADDVVVAELDVVLSNELPGLQSQLVMLQQPLRPNWRAYDAGAPGMLAPDMKWNTFGKSATPL